MNKKAIIFISVMLLAVGMAGAFTLAYFTDLANSTAGTKTGIVSVEVRRGGGIRVESLSETPTYVRIRVLPENGESFIEPSLTKPWTKGSDGYYYYEQALEKEATENLFPNSTSAEGLLIYAEGVQAETFNNALEAFDAITPE